MSTETRLDRLLNLLHSGSSAATRNAAAQQIGEIQKYHPYDLQKLLLRVHEFLRNDKWETRIAAGQAFAAIVSNVPQWDPEFDPNKEAEKVATNTGSLTFDNIDFNNVLNFGTELLASGGAEYEDMDASLNPEDRLQTQKNQLEKRMGVVGQFMELGDMLDDKDFEPCKQSLRESIDNSEAKRKAADIAAVLNNAGSMSARERNRMKRKAKEIAKTKEQERRLNASSGSLRESMSSESTDKKKEFKNVVTAQPQKSDKLVIEAVADTEAMIHNENVWPFHLICALLLNEMFDPCWEIRHGAIVGLREILKVHCNGSGKTTDVDKEKQKEQNKQWLQDCCIRLLCILALDRFGDYVSGDQVVVPVRETCAQALGALIGPMDQEDALKTHQVLLDLMKSPKWEVRHGGLLGLKYLIAVRTDLLSIILPTTIEPILQGLIDNYDDVRSVASETLLPVAPETAKICYNELPRILSTLWDILLDLDDLTASTNSVMNLLAEFYSIPETAIATQKMLKEKQENTSAHPLATLIPRLWPFLLHNISSVRLATLKTLIKLFSLDESTLNANSEWLKPIISSGLSYVFQTILLETKNEIIETAIEFWKLFITKVSSQIQGIENYLKSWLYLLSTPIGQNLQQDMLIIPDYHCTEPGMELDNITTTGKRPNPIDLDSYESQPKRKQRKINSDEFVSDISSTAQIQQQCTPLMRNNGCNAIAYLFQYIQLESLSDSYSMIFTYLTSQSSSRCIVAGLILESIGSNMLEVNIIRELPEEITQRTIENLTESSSYLELQPYSQKMIEEYQVLVTSMISFGAPVSAFTTIDKLNMKIAYYTATNQFNEFMKQLEKTMDESTKGQLIGRQQQLLATIDMTQKIESQIITSIRGTMATVLVVWNQIPEKLNPIIRSLMSGIKKENLESLQKLFANSTAKLTKLIINRNPCPNSKIITNLCNAIGNQSSNNEDILSRRGAEYCIQSMADVFKEKLLDDLPKIKEILISIKNYDSSDHDEIQSKKIIETLNVYLILLPVICNELFSFFLEMFPIFFKLVRTSDKIIRSATAKVIATYCKVNTLSCMKLILSDFLPFLNKTEDENSRMGVAESIQYIIEYLDIDVVPYLVFLVVPTLGRMSDQSISVRKIVTRSFATLVRLMPLESGIEDPDGFTDEMKKRKIEERKFLEQLLDTSKLDSYELPIPVNAQLRKYQQEGLNWLAFLQKYQLHGILCDDMGLGKTLQTLCIIVSSNYIRKCKFEKTKDPSCAVLPSLVVCPPTVVGHWFHETKKFFEGYATAIQYTGRTAERTSLRKEIKKHDIVIMSYDILRNDIQYLKEISWNYCALDEGHIIRNSKTRITQAAKQINANHRLVLSGTPIQNNVLELWSLFDFLMPGFLGTEQQFNQLYGKPIIASKDPKCSQKDQERGTIALESLHRQVLPFLLRRVKEDVLHDLPPKIIQDYYCELSSLQKRLYEDFAHSPTCKTIQSKISVVNDEDNNNEEPSRKKGTHVFQALQYLRKLCNHPLLVLNEQHPEYNLVMENFKESGDSIHSIHHAPKLVALKELLIECGIGNNSSSTSDIKNQSDNSIDIIDSSNSIVQHRVLIFAQLKLMLDIIESDLLKKCFPNISYLRLDGGVNSNKRHDIVTKFNEDPTIDILLLTTHVGGLGLNLTGADTVIFVEHDWNPMKDLQAMDRAHRLGQTKVVNVYRLITRGTLEEKIMGLQKFKLNIANSVVNQENSSLRTMDTNQLLDLFDINEDSNNNNNSSKQDSGVDELGNIKKKSATQIVESLEELWDDSQYSEEYDLDTFVASLNKT